MRYEVIFFYHVRVIKFRKLVSAMENEYVWKQPPQYKFVLYTLCNDVAAKLRTL
jgi:hypothetical protein